MYQACLETLEEVRRQGPVWIEHYNLDAPQSGRESREQLREYVQRAEETDHEQADIATQTLAFNHRSIHTDSPKIR